MKDQLFSNLAGTHTANSVQETMDLAGRLAECIEGGELLLFSAKMGAGKTHFVKGMLAALGFDEDEVTSPSFSLVNRYDSKPVVYHLDLWRLDESSNPAFAVGLDDLIDEDSAVVIIEWAEKLRKTELPKPFYEIEIEVLNETSRTINFKKIE